MDKGENERPLALGDNNMISKDQLGIYVHIPFCLQKCHYCDFCSFPRAEREHIARYVDALIAQIGSWSERCAAHEVDTVYFGGGTPTMLTLSEWERLTETLRRCFHIRADAEITAETNPATVDQRYLRDLRGMGVNRLSMGVQSASDVELKALGRAHDFAGAQRTFADARAAGFDNISIDLMLAIPHQTRASLDRTLREFVALSPEHISGYLLKIEEGTPFGRMADRLPLPDEDETVELYLDTVGKLAEAGYAQYEISNFAREGRASRHNLRYWQGRPYLGLGLAAHSDFGGRRFAAGRDMAAYLRGDRIEESAEIGAEERREEYVMLRLRLNEGIDVADYAARFGRDFYGDFENALAPYRRAGLLREAGGRVALTPSGMLLSNSVLADMLGNG
jgi:oxygen-independent coproporphyrinogen-3 oxidase